MSDITKRAEEWLSKVPIAATQTMYGVDDCWLWQAGKNAKGYGAVYGKTAHRLSWELHFGKIPEGLCVLHVCDNRGCVNPAHLMLGTVADNNYDRMVKGRNGVNGKSGAKITEEEAKEIKSSTERVAELALRFGIYEVSVYNIKNGSTWREVCS